MVLQVATILINFKRNILRIFCHKNGMDLGVQEGVEKNQNILSEKCLVNSSNCKCLKAMQSPCTPCIMQ